MPWVSVCCLHLQLEYPLEPFDRDLANGHWNLQSQGHHIGKMSSPASAHNQGNVVLCAHISIFTRKNDLDLQHFSTSLHVILHNNTIYNGTMPMHPDGHGHYNDNGNVHLHLHNVSCKIACLSHRCFLHCCKDNVVCCWRCHSHQGACNRYHLHQVILLVAKRRLWANAELRQYPHVTWLVHKLICILHVQGQSMLCNQADLATKGDH